MSKNKQTDIALSLGGNMGNVRDEFRKTLVKLKSGGLSSICVSSLYSTPAVGCAPGTADFINAVVTGRWSSSLESLLRLCKKIEVSAGRPEKHIRYSSRPLDIDIILFGDMIRADERITIPHKEAQKRLFVLIPLAEIAGDWIFPDTGKKISSFLRRKSSSSLYRTIIRSRFPIGRNRKIHLTKL